MGWGSKGGTQGMWGGGRRRRMGETFLFLPLRNLVPVRSRLGEEEAPKGNSCSAWTALVSYHLPLQRDSVTPRLIHMQKAQIKAPNEE